MIHPDTPEVKSLNATPEEKAFVEEMQDVLRCEQAWGIAHKHLDAAYQRGRESVFAELREYASKLEEKDVVV